MVKVNIFGNAHAHRLSYGRGVRLVSPEIAEKLVDARVAEILQDDKGVEVAVMPEPEAVEKAAPMTSETLKPKAKPKAPRAKAKPRKKK